MRRGRGGRERDREIHRVPCVSACFHLCYEVLKRGYRGSEFHSETQHVKVRKQDKRPGCCVGRWAGVSAGTESAEQGGRGLGAAASDLTGRSLPW